MSWARAIIFEKNGEEAEVVVPSAWLRSGFCYWSDSLHARRDLEEMRDIDEDWPRFKLKKVKIMSGI